MPAKALVALSLQDDRYSYLPLIPLISIFLIFVDRQRIFRERRFTPKSGTLLYAVAILVYLAALRAEPNRQVDHLWLEAVALAMVWIAVFLFLNGPKCATAAMFPLCFLGLMIPVPTYIMDQAVHGLQRSSAEVTEVLFRIIGTPALRHDFRFSLPGIDIEVAEACSGIRSTSALLITGIVAAHLFLRSSWHQISFILFTIPVAIFKNAVRIVTLSWLGVYVDPTFLQGSLHRNGGVLFASAGIGTLIPILLLMRKWERAAGTRGRLAIDTNRVSSLVSLKRGPKKVGASVLSALDDARGRR